jgi:hypothetical protein
MDYNLNNSTVGLEVSEFLTRGESSDVGKTIKLVKAATAAYRGAPPWSRHAIVCLCDARADGDAIVQSYGDIDAHAYSLTDQHTGAIAQSHGNVDQRAFGHTD